jgi:tetratricopeptide (TPR) repeat protein
LNRDVSVDPAVRLVTTDPLAFGQSPVYDAILVDIPPLWAFGAAWATSARRFRAIAGALAPGGTAVFRFPLATLSADELRYLTARVTDTFGGVTAWLDPAGVEHLLLTATREDGAVDAGAVFRAWERPSIRSDLRRAAVDRPAAVLDRALADRPALLLMSSDMPRRDAVSVSILAGRRLEAGARVLPLAALAAAAVAPRGLFQLDRVPQGDRAALEERLARSGRVRGTYLEMLGHLAAGNHTAAMEAAKKLPDEGGAVSDLRVITEPWLRRGDTLMAKGLTQAAHIEYLLAYSFSPRDVEANRKLADTYRLQGKLDDARTHYATARELDPTNLKAALGLADAHARGGDLRLAASVLREIELDHPAGYVLLVHLAHFEMELATRHPAEARERAGRARVLLQRAAALEPTRPQARAGLARVYFLDEEWDRALEEIDRAMTLESSCMYRFWRGLIQYQIGTLDAAAADLKKSLLACPANHDARVALGAVYAAEGKTDQAETTWKDVLLRDPGNADARRNLETLEATTFVPRGD